MQRGRVDRQTGRFQQGERVRERQLHAGQAEYRPHGRADDLGRKRVGAAFAQHYGAEGERLCRPQDRAKVARVLQAVEQQYLLPVIERRCVPLRLHAGKNNVLRTFHLAREAEQRVLRAVHRRALLFRLPQLPALEAAPHEHSLDLRARAQCLGQHFFALAQHFAGRAAVFPLPSEPRQMLERSVLTALYLYHFRSTTLSTLSFAPGVTSATPPLPCRMTRTLMPYLARTPSCPSVFPIQLRGVLISRIEKSSEKPM